jgi:hypothetical protein
LLLKQQAKLKVQIAIVIHGRDAFDEIFAIRRRKVSRFVRDISLLFRNQEQALQAISYNMKLYGVVTLKMVK